MGIICPPLDSNMVSASTKTKWGQEPNVPICPDGPAQEKLTMASSVRIVVRLENRVAWRGIFLFCLNLYKIIETNRHYFLFKSVSENLKMTFSCRKCCDTFKEWFSEKDTISVLLLHLLYFQLNQYVLYSPVYKCWPKTSWTGSQDNHQNFDPSLPLKNLWLLFMGLIKKKEGGPL